MFLLFSLSNSSWALVTFRSRRRRGIIWERRRLKPPSVGLVDRWGSIWPLLCSNYIISWNKESLNYTGCTLAGCTDGRFRGAKTHRRRLIAGFSHQRLLCNVLWGSVQQPAEQIVRKQLTACPDLWHCEDIRSAFWQKAFPAVCWRILSLHQYVKSLHVLVP